MHRLTELAGRLTLGVLLLLVAVAIPRRSGF
jgi:hypothetical protein